MIKLILFLGLFGVVNSSCGLKTCDCLNIASLDEDRDKDEPLPPVDCNPTMLCDYGNIEFNLTESEIEPPSAVDFGFLAFSHAGYYPVDLVEALGMICENGSWYATKYPEGVQYTEIEGDKVVIHVPERDGGGYYKSKITLFSCSH